MASILKNDEVLLQHLQQQLGLEIGEVKEVLGYLDTFTGKDELSGHLQGMLGDDEASNKIIQRALSIKFPSESSGINETEKNSEPKHDLTSKVNSSPEEFKPKFPNKQANSKNSRGPDPIKLQSQFYRKGDKEELEEYRVARLLPSDCYRSANAAPTKHNGSPIYNQPLQKPQTIPVSEAYRNIKIREDRKECACYGQNHEVFLNCLRCGRIGCKSEGPGPCFFCKFPLLSADQQRQDLQKAHDLTGGSKAQAHLERLLEFDRTSAARTQVIDQASDYSVPDLVEPSDKWLSPAERTKSQESKKKSWKQSKNRSVVLEFCLSISKIAKCLLLR
ncbi:Activating signal cointegrator 1 [Entomophthora muscae]|uniref:Activating signal cointegrator 1 n=1 Tax=Entomophthora muscae TaxID=34485 RepID=A0ACC2TLT4_9FUNG|nr:Activating signal cointegrator 1 [Entomophthora muscae]